MQKICKINVSKEVKISLFLLLIPFVISSLMVWPNQENFEMKGDIASVKELGVKGSVHFTYVKYGQTESLADKWMIAFSNPDAEFTPVYDNNEAQSEEGNQIGPTKKEVISNAVSSAEDKVIHNSKGLIERVSEIQNLASSYEGNSFGLMLGIGLIEEKKNKDYSRNHTYTIAGTGTLEEDYRIGSVGSIRLKLLTAEENGADIFFVPKDREKYGEYSNETEAFRVVEEQELSLKVVPVSRLQDAIYYLEYKL
ncbi:hypothetical protein [Pontibacillus sp. HMF3514]|uniref:hypothetical protein n=1 Tax=Pontibacillus sp. HMF3514 TaxID=2692425 RepID=UPI00131F9269|nr:hypothetical protein [Pontibacillus sp. HMF3514]QHE52847.1 hypothetical protein GS400_12805 [Pontibacillus sp. HMF3514]